MQRQSSSHTATRTNVYTKFYFLRPNIIKFNDLYSSNNVSLLCKLCKFISIANEKANPPGKIVNSYLYLHRNIHYFILYYNVCTILNVYFFLYSHAVKCKWLYNTVTSSMLQIKTEERDI